MNARQITFTEAVNPVVLKLEAADFNWFINQ